MQRPSHPRQGFGERFPSREEPFPAPRHHPLQCGVTAGRGRCGRRRNHGMAAGGPVPQVKAEQLYFKSRAWLLLTSMARSRKGIQVQRKNSNMQFSHCHISSQLLSSSISSTPDLLSPQLEYGPPGQPLSGHRRGPGPGRYLLPGPAQLHPRC